jgi:hypothetical protein
MRRLHNSVAVLLLLGAPLAICLLAWGVDWIVGQTEYQAQQRLEFAIRKSNEQRAAAPPAAALPGHVPDQHQ